jgi:hypothetical protein
VGHIFFSPVSVSKASEVTQGMGLAFHQTTDSGTL